MSGRADEFAVALNTLDETGDTQQIARLFADGAELNRPELPGEPTEKAEAFWAGYHQQFHDLATSFTSIVDAGDLAVLEWTSRGRLATGRPIQYAGVSILTFDDADRITRFVTYYDTAAFTKAASNHTADR